MPITRFVAKGNTYTFPTNPGEQDYRDNFAELRDRDSSIAGADGAFDEDGSDRAPSKKGQVQVSTYLVSDTREGMQILRDAVKKMQTLGTGRLFFQPTDTNLAERWCWAKAVKVDTPEKRHEHTDLQQPVQISFKVDDPFWYTATGLTVWGGGTSVKWGAGTTVKWGGGTPSSASGLLTTLTLTNNGNVYSQPQFAIRPDTGQSCNDPIIRRVVEGEVVDEVAYFGALTVGDNLVIDCRKARVLLNDAVVYNNLFSYRHPAWFRLMPGANTVQVLFAQAADAAKVNAKFYERYV